MKDYIVTFKGDSNLLLLDKYGASSVYVPKNLSFIALCKLDDDKAIQLKSEKEILSVEKDVFDDFAQDESGGQGISYTIDLSEVKKFHAIGIKGKGVKVAIFDSGCQKHEDLIIKGGINAFNQSESYHNAYNSHGTMVAGIIGMQDNDKGYLGIAPDCDLYIVKLDDNAGSNNGSRWSEQIIGMNWAIENDIDVINCSFSGFQDSVARRAAFKKAYDAGIAIFCSAGNKQTGITKTIDTIGYPSRYPFVITSANVNSDKTHRPSSCVGSRINFASGGVDIPSTTTDSSKEVSDKYRTGTGTSYSSPSVAGIYALYKQMFPNDTRDKILERMYRNAEKVGNSWETGAGIPKFPNMDYKNITLKSREGD